ncbi:MAG: hypothetical protein HKN16_10215 [Saprospiraceae bacterium]|nr:hypothetical protein [Saprospiraceae bacterium]
MSYENASALKPGQVQVSGAYGTSDEHRFEDDQFNFVQNYFGRVGVGLKGGFGLYGSYYHKGRRDPDGLWSFSDDYETSAYDLYELGFKYTIIEKELALKGGLGMYFVENDYVAQGLNLQIIYSYRFNPHIDGSLIMHGTGVYEQNGYGLVLGLNAGAGFSTNLERWAIRPEIGFNMRTFTAGIGLEIKLNKMESALKKAR